MKFGRIIAVSVLAATVPSGVIGCSKSVSSTGETVAVVLREPINELERERVPGTIDDAWVEPMIDSVRVPGQLDPNGVYYRPSHETIVEIRHGKFQKVEYPEDPRLRERW